jgi:acyl-CoA synthetase (AMP-forming)/AMP-acid ligase II
MRLRQHARYRAGKAAIVERGRHIDYRQLDRMVDFSCHALRSMGIARGQLVGVSLQDRAEYLVILLAMSRLGADGFLYLRGRSRDMIIRGGVNIYPSDIESVVLRYPGVIEASAVAVPSQEFGEEIAVAFVARSVIEIEVLHAHCAAELARFKIPHYFLPFEELPKAGVGKADRKCVAATVITRIAGEALR